MSQQWILCWDKGFFYCPVPERGIQMKLENYEVHLPSYSIGDQIYDKIGPVCESYGKNRAGDRRAQGAGRSL